MIKTLIAVAVAGAFALPVAAAPSASDDRATSSGAGATADSRFDQLDRNNDGFISRDEAKDAAELNTRFTELDKNNDNKLTREEYEAVNADTRGATGATGMGRAPGKGGGDSSTTGATTK